MNPRAMLRSTHVNLTTLTSEAFASSPSKICFFIQRLLCHDAFTQPSSRQSVVHSVCSLVCESYSRNAHVGIFPRSLGLEVNVDSLSDEDCVSIVASLAVDAESMVAVSFFYWATGHPKFRHFMRFYIVCVSCLIRNGNLERAGEVVECMVRNFGEVWRLEEAFGVVLDLRNEGLILSARLMNGVMRAGCDMGLVDFAEKVFAEMCEGGVAPDANS